MTIQELLKQQQLGQGGASQYLSMPQQQYGASQYLGGLLGPELNFNAPSGTIYPQYSGQTYQPTPWEGPSEMYKLGSLLSQSNEPLFRWVGNDMMKKTPMATWTITQN
jgi:hypothetical protein